MTADHFGGERAARYDAGLGAMGEADAIDPVVDVLAGLAGDGAALEFAIGTGRIALPLAARGVEVHGLELSADMVAHLRSKPGGEAIPVTIGDMAVTSVPGGPFRVVYLVFNTIQNLTTQDAQVSCFMNAAAHLAPGGAFVIETGTPDLRLLPPGQSVVPFTVTPTYISVDEYTDLTHHQQFTSHHTTTVDGAGRRASVPFRYVWPAELDLMARIAGLQLRDRWADWQGTAFTGDDRQHVSIWTKPE